MGATKLCLKQSKLVVHRNGNIFLASSRSVKFHAVLTFRGFLWIFGFVICCTKEFHFH